MMRPAAGNFWIGAVLGLMAVNSAWSAEPATASPPIVLRAAHLFDSVSGKLVDHGVIVVSGTQIQAVDVNGDGKPDVLTAARKGVFVFLNNIRR